MYSGLRLPLEGTPRDVNEICSEQIGSGLLELFMQPYNKFKPLFLHFFMSRKTDQ